MDSEREKSKEAIVAAIEQERQRSKVRIVYVHVRLYCALAAVILWQLPLIIISDSEDIGIPYR